MRKNLIGFILILVLFLSFPLAFAAEPIPKAESENYCKDPASWAQWDALIAKYPNDKDVQTLHALRVGLCIKIEQGTITIQDAINLFDRAHKMVIREKLAEQNKGKKSL
jgi:hypothetical protein